MYFSSTLSVLNILLVTLVISELGLTSGGSTSRSRGRNTRNSNSTSNSNRTEEITPRAEECTGKDWFQCNNRKCISSKWVCDGVHDCSLNKDGDISDEIPCDDDESSGSVHKKEAIDMCMRESDNFRCANNHCIPSSFFCDGDDDCADKSDEPDGCEAKQCVGQFRCVSGECIENDKKCDKNVDCNDGWSDEENCFVAPHECLKEEGKFHCKSGKECIDASQVCDKKPDCLDKSDEFVGCEKSCFEANTTKTICSQGCIPNPDLSKPGDCYCFKGYTPSSRKKGACEDVDECEEFGTCSQMCTNKLGSYECSCVDGFRLKNTSSCEIVVDNARLVFATHSGIRVLSLGEDETYYPIVEDMGNPISITYNARSNYVYWSDVKEKQEAIWRCKLNNSSTGSSRVPEHVVSTGVILPEGLAFDWIGNNLYFADSSKSHIVVCNADTVVCTVLIHEEMDKPRDIALHPNLGLLFWTDWGASPSIISAGMDGYRPTAIIRDNLKWPNGITVDHGNGRIYWTDASKDRIETARLDGTDRRIVRSKGIKHPFGVDVLGDMVIWSDWNLFEIQGSNKFDGSGHIMLIKEPFQQLNGLAMVHEANQPITRKNHCKNAGCSHICTLTSKDNFRCLCPAGMYIDQRNKKTCTENRGWPLFLIGYNNTLKVSPIDSVGGNVFKEFQLPGLSEIGALAVAPYNNSLFVSDLITKKIYSYDIVSKGLTVLVHDDVFFVKGMDYDEIGNNLYWVDSAKKTVEVLSLRSGTRVTLYKETDKPVDIIVVPELRLVFIALIGMKGGKISRMNMDGFNRRILIRQSNGEPIGLTYNKELQRLYWTDAMSESIQTVAVDGSSDYIAIGRGGAPFGIASFGKKIFWTDRQTQELKGERLDITGDERPVFVGNYNSTRVTSEGLVRSYNGNFLAKVKIMNKDLGYSHSLLESHDCSFKNPCSHMCLMSDKENVGTCRCPEYLMLDSDGKTCVNLKPGDTTTPVVCTGGKCRKTTTPTTKKPKKSSKDKEKDATKDKFIPIPEKTEKGADADKSDGKSSKDKGSFLDSDWDLNWPDYGDDNNIKKSKSKKPSFREREPRKQKELEYDDYEGSPIISKKSSVNKAKITQQDSGMDKVAVTDGTNPLAIVLAVLILLILVGFVVGIILHRRNVHPKVLVRPYVQHWVKYVNQPVQRFFDNRGEQDGKKHIYDEVYHESGSDQTYSNAGYEEIDSITDLQGSTRVNVYEEPADSHRISYSHTDKLIDRD